jgi:hypothetical protein
MLDEGSCAANLIFGVPKLYFRGQHDFLSDLGFLNISKLRLLICHITSHHFVKFLSVQLVDCWTV